MAEEDNNLSKSHGEVKVEVSIDLSGFKAGISTEVKRSEANEVFSTFLDNINSNIDKVKKIYQKVSEIETKTISPQISKEIAIPRVTTITSSDEPLQRIADDLNTDISIVKNSKIVAFKPGLDKPQIVNPSRFSPENGALIILYSFEIGLKKHFVSFEEADTVYQDCHYKQGSVAARTIPALKQRGYIDQKKYDTSKELTLSPKGLETIRKIFKKELGIN